MVEFFDSIAVLWLANPIAQSIGFAASLAYFIAALQKEDKKLFGFMLIGTLGWLVHYGMIGAWVASIGFIVGVIRNAIAYFKLATAPRKLWLTVLLCAAYAIIGFFTIRQPWDFLPVIGSSLYVIASYNTKGINMRWLFLGAQLCYTVYALFVGSIAGVLDGVVDTALTLFTMCRLMAELKKPIE